MQEEVDEPWVLSATDDDIREFLDQQNANDANYEDVRDHLMFNFNNDQDLHLFIEHVRRKEDIRVNFSLNGREYLSNNVHH